MLSVIAARQAGVPKRLAIGEARPAVRRRRQVMTLIPRESGLGRHILTSRKQPDYRTLSETLPLPATAAGSVSGTFSAPVLQFPPACHGCPHGLPSTAEKMRSFSRVRKMPEHQKV
jgi:hypothetical protein